MIQIQEMMEIVETLAIQVTVEIVVMAVTVKEVLQAAQVQVHQAV